MGQQVEELRGAREGRTVAYTQFLNDYKKDQVEIVYYWCPVKLFCVPKIKVGFLAWNPTFFVTFVFVTKPK